MAESFFFNHLMFLRRQQGRFTEAEEICRRAVERYPVWGYATAHCLFLAEVGRLDEAEDALSRHLSTTPPGDRRLSAFWLAYLGEVCHLVGDLGNAARLYDALLPFAGGHVAYGVMSFSLGVVDRYLGLLAITLQRFDDAESHFEAAHRLHDGMGARAWAVQTRADHGRMLLARGGPGDRERASGLLERARTAFVELGASAQAERIAALLEAPRRTVFRLEGDEWLLEFEGQAIHLRDSKGLQYLARLVVAPGKEIHALDLAGERMLDAERARQRLADLKAEIDDARATHDVGRLQGAEDEFDGLVARLRGVARTPDAERARQSISRAVKGAIDRIAAAHPSLGEHLRTTVRTGAYSTYAPDPRSRIEWET
jgi:tetratricopeptide (TPR) repeat protein